MEANLVALAYAQEISRQREEFMNEQDDTSVRPSDSDKLKEYVRQAIAEALKTAPPPQAEPLPKTSVWIGIFTTISSPTAILSAIGIAVVGALGFGMYFSGGHLLESLQHTEIARGLITFLIAVATVSIAIILTLYAVLSADSTIAKERFPMAKEILTLLIGILGTILGFYFGSADKVSATLDLGDIQLSQQQLFTRVSGGTPPYRYTIMSSDPDFKVVKDAASDGWIIQSLQATPKAGSTITVGVVDGKDLRAEKKREIPPLAKETKIPAPAGPSAVPSAPTTGASNPIPVGGAASKPTS